MQKRDFIQQATLQYMPELGWDMDKSLKYAEALWARLTDKGYGDLKASEPKAIPMAYDKLSPVMKSAFDLFWLAFGLKKGKDKAAARWLQLGEMDKATVDRVIAGAKRTAAERKNLPPGQIPIHAQGWLTERRWQDHEENGADADNKASSKRSQDLAMLKGDLAHAEKMAGLVGNDADAEFWAAEADRLRAELARLSESQTLPSGA